ncbi:MAG: ATP-binding protein [Phycisphaeraceae bacterium]
MRPPSQLGPGLLFDVISRSCERARVIVTTNLPFEDWVAALGAERGAGVGLMKLHLPLGLPGGCRGVE